VGFWLDEKFEIQKAVLGVQPLQGDDKKADGIGTILSAMLLKVLPAGVAWHATTDNGANFVNAVKEQLLHQHTRCFAHTVQLVVRKALEQHKAPGVSQRSRRLFSSRRCSQLTGKGSGHLPRSRPQPGVCRVTRWSSEFHSIESVLTSEKALIQVQYVKKEHQLSELDFLALKELAVALEPFACAATMLEGEKYPTLNLMIPVWKKIEQAKNRQQSWSER